MNIVLDNLLYIISIVVFSYFLFRKRYLIKNKRIVIWTLSLIFLFISICVFGYYSSGYNILVEKYRSSIEVNYDDSQAYIRVKKIFTDGIIGYYNKLTVNNVGVYFDISGWLWTPPLFIPWEDVCNCQKTSNWGEYWDISILIKNTPVIVELRDKEDKFFILCERYAAKTGCAK